MARRITERELRNGSGETMRALDRGECFVVTRDGIPVGELVPMRRRHFVRADTVMLHTKVNPWLTNVMSFPALLIRATSASEGKRATSRMRVRARQRCHSRSTPVQRPARGVRHRA
jgi:antitoxin (DNA-binding transcriptional repressor) of toxin-antitoxin stability system